MLLTSRSASTVERAVQVEYGWPMQYIRVGPSLKTYPVRECLLSVLSTIRITITNLSGYPNVEVSHQEDQIEMELEDNARCVCKLSNVFDGD